MLLAAVAAVFNAALFSPAQTAAAEPAAAPTTAATAADDAASAVKSGDKTTHKAPRNKLRFNPLLYVSYKSLYIVILYDFFTLHLKTS